MMWTLLPLVACMPVRFFDDQIAKEDPSKKKTKVVLMLPEDDLVALKEFRKFGVQFHNQSYLLVYMKKSTNVFTMLASHYQIDDKSTLVIDEPSTQLRYILKKAITLDNIREFVGSHIRGQLSPTLKSEPLPDQGMFRPFKRLVGLNFQDEVLKTDREFFIKLEDSTDDVSRLRGDFQQVAQEIQRNKNLVLAKLNMRMNEIIGLRASLFEDLPAFVWYPRGAKTASEFQVYKGQHNFNSIMEWLKGKTQFEWVEGPNDIDQQNL